MNFKIDRHCSGCVMPHKVVHVVLHWLYTLTRLAHIMNEFSLAKNVYLFQCKTESCLQSLKAQIDKSGNYVFQDADTIEFHTKRNNYDLVQNCHFTVKY